MLQLHPNETDSVSRSFLAIYRETIEDIYAAVSRRCGGDRALAEDVTQETYLRAVMHWQAQGLPDNPAAWLHTVARNLLLSHFRKRRPDSIDAEQLNALFEQDDKHDDPDRAAAVQWALARLNAKQARLIESFHIDGRSMKELAEEWRTSERAIEGLLYRARGKLRRKLETYLKHDDLNRSGGREP